jgi:peroxiredoxin
VLRIAFLPRHQPFFSLFVFLFKMIMALQTGQTAPDFTLFNSDKKEVSLSALRGSNVLLLFFPLAFTSVCTAELCAVRDNLEQYNKANAKVLGISVDSPYTLAKFKEEQRLNFDLLSDFNKEVSGAYGALYTDFAFGMKGVSKRAAFLIDKEGIIQYAEVLENAGKQPDFGNIVSTLEEILLTV